MTRERRGYVLALVAAVLALVVSVGAVVALMAPGSPWQPGYDPARAGSSGWWHGPAGTSFGHGHVGGAMMGDWGDDATAELTPEAARAAAEAWVAANEPGASVGEGVAMPMGHAFPLSRDGQVVGTVVVDDDNGTVVWWAQRQPSPAASAS